MLLRHAASYNQHVFSYYSASHWGARAVYIQPHTTCTASHCSLTYLD